MISLRTRNQSRLHVSDSGSDKQDISIKAVAKGDCTVPQQTCGGVNEAGVRKRGRKPKIKTPVPCAAHEADDSHKDTLVGPPVQDWTGGKCMTRPGKRRGKRPACVMPCCEQISCKEVPAVPCQQKPQRKRGRPPKQCKTIRIEERKGDTIEKRHDGIAAEKQRKECASVVDPAVNLQSGSCQSGSLIRKSRGRKSKSQPGVKRVGPEVGNKSSNVSGRVRVAGCDSEDTDPVKKRKTGRKPGLLHRKTRGLEGQAARTLSSSAHVKCEVEKPLPEATADPGTDVKTATPELRHSRKTRSGAHDYQQAKQAVYNTKEQNASCQMQTCNPSTHRDLEKTVDCTLPGIKVNTHSSKTCYSISPGLPYPLVRLKNCRHLHKQHSTNIKLECNNGVKDVNSQKQIYLVDIVASDSDNISTLDKAESNDFLESALDHKKPNQINKFLKVKCKLKHPAQKINSCIEDGDGSYSRSKHETVTVENRKGDGSIARSNGGTCTMKNEEGIGSSSRSYSSTVIVGNEECENSSSKTNTGIVTVENGDGDGSSSRSYSSTVIVRNEECENSSSKMNTGMCVTVENGDGDDPCSMFSSGIVTKESKDIDNSSAMSKFEPVTVENECQQFMLERTGHVSSSSSHIGSLLKEINNNTAKSENLNLINEQNTAEGHSTLWGSWRPQPPILSEEDISDKDSIDLKCSTPIRALTSTTAYSNSPQAVENVNISCQRIIQFAGKSKWKSSCARSCVWTFPLKRVSDSDDIVILGVRADRSLAVYSDDIQPLFDSITDNNIKERTEDIDSRMEIKKRKMENIPPLNLNSSKDNEKELSDILFTIGDSSDTSVTIASLPSEAEDNDGYTTTSIDFKMLMKNTNNQYSSTSKGDKNPMSPVTTFTVLESSQVTRPESPIKQRIEEEIIPSSVALLDIGENSNLQCEIVPTVGNHFQKEMSLSAVHNEEDAAAVTGKLPVYPEKNLESDVQISQSHNSYADYTGTPTVTIIDSEDRDCVALGLSDKDSLRHKDMRDSLVTLDNKKASDVLDTYEDDVLVLDVIPDDPELFGVSSEEEFNFPKGNHNVQSSVSKPKMMIPLICKVPVHGTAPASESKVYTHKTEHSSERCTNLENYSYAAVETPPFMCSTIPEAHEQDVEFFTNIDDTIDAYEEADKNNVQDTCRNDKKESENSTAAEEILPVSRVHFSNPSFHAVHPESTFQVPFPPRVQGYQQIKKGIPSPNVMKLDIGQKWKPENTYTCRIQQTMLPMGYCRPFFNTLLGCRHMKCLYLHIPRQSDEKLCMELLRKMLNETHTILLKRAVWIFTKYYSQHSPRIHFEKEIFSSLLNPLLHLSWWQDILLLLETAAAAKIQPAINDIIKVFERVSSAGLESVLPHLVDLLSKFVDAGLNLTLEEINKVIAEIKKLNPSRNHTNTLLSMKARLEGNLSNQKWTYDFNTAIAEIEHCKVSSNWARLGSLYLNVCSRCENITDLKSFSRTVAEALMEDSIEQRSDIPYAEFADTVFKHAQLNDIQNNFLGRIGISVMFSYHRKELWQKARRVLNKLREIQINYTTLKGIESQESATSRCHLVNIAVEIFLKCGNLINAVQVLKDSDWILQTALWPCDRMDVLKRHNLLCTIVEEALSKSMFTLCFEVLKNLPGVKQSKADITVSQFCVLFNKVLRSCVENRSLGISCSIVDFMVTKNIQVDYLNLQLLITMLGHSRLWPKARRYYNCAMSLGFFSFLDGSFNHKILLLPCFMTDVEMLISIERFMVLNAKSIQSSSGCNQCLQIILKRTDEESAQHKDSYHVATDRLFEASRLSKPRLFIKHMTVNNANEQVYILDYNSSLKWLNENMQWAGNIWSQQL